MAISNEENEQNKDSDKFGKVVEALHNKQELPSLRTYQGDMAKFIKEKNESVISIAVKEKERKEEREKREENKIQTGEIKIAPKPKPKTAGRFKENMILVSISLLLVAGGFVGVLFVLEVLKTEPSAKVVLEKTVIPYNEFVTFAISASESLGPELSKVLPTNGITLVKISGSDGMRIQNAKDFFRFMDVSLPFTLSRTLRNDYAIGAIFQNGEVSPFIVITVNDFGGAFAGMLDWEESLLEDLDFLNSESKIDMTSLISTTTLPLKKDAFVWKDIIIKNKDTRALVNEKGKSRIAYTFLDKNTLLIIRDIYAIGEISSIYASRSVAR